MSRYLPTHPQFRALKRTRAAQSFRNSIEGGRDCGDEMRGPTSGAGTTSTGEHMPYNRFHLRISGEFAFARDQQAQDGHTSVATPDVKPDDIMGTMAANSSPNDPVFFLHHANMDRLWSAWIARTGICSRGRRSSRAQYR